MIRRQSIAGAVVALLAACGDTAGTSSSGQTATPKATPTPTSDLRPAAAWYTEVADRTDAQLYTLFRKLSADGQSYGAFTTDVAAMSKALSDADDQLGAFDASPAVLADLADGPTAVLRDLSDVRANLVEDVAKLKAASQQPTTADAQVHFAFALGVMGDLAKSSAKMRTALGLPKQADNPGAYL